MNLFQLGNFKLHSGSESKWKIECDSLTDDEIEAVAYMLKEKMLPFSKVYGVPMGGLRLARAMENYIKSNEDVILIVDDVLTTGNSMIKFKNEIETSKLILGAVIFARNKTFPWITPLFQM